ncbi:MAG: ThuA domain-containing protein [Verrucomicrobiales bacterium]
MSRALLILLSALVNGSAATNLPVQKDLLIHIDAAAQNGFREKAEAPPLRNTQKADFIFGEFRNETVTFRQSNPEARPGYVSDEAAAYFKFDGKDDYLEMAGGAGSAQEMTIFVLAAPRENPGSFSGILSFAGFGQNDYTSGLNIDFGPAPTKDLSVLNVESTGSGGFKDMLTPGFFNAADRPFGEFHLITVRTKPGKAGTDLFLDGFKGGDRDRTLSTIRMDQVALGSRYYSHDPAGGPYAQGFFHGNIAEVVVYHRALTDEERIATEQALLAKTVPLNALLKGAKGHSLETLKDPPVVQMFVPGFIVQELPLDIANLNNVRYRHDGKLVGLGYDGKIYLLTDTDGDGLEDKADLFWGENTLRSPLGMALTEKNDPRGDGVFVTSKGKVSFILDRDRDGKADEEKVIASGWAESWHGVDAIGMAVDPKDGSIYFGFGCANFVDAYQMNPTTGKSQYRLDDFRGTIQRISADFSQREAICTGVRFTCALAFNREGDLFATDQEGATWLPNGNPLDELLHIKRGKHYGFPPRHPKHLPDVMDEPAVYEYGPQHQSTVGMVFNYGVNGGPHFGPAFWNGDALVSGESRGKLYRTKLAKSPAGYVAQNQQIASLSMLLVDSCVTPSGDLILACHSGPPDWGTGPAGKGKLFKVRYTGQQLPQPVAAWASAPDEFRVAFDRPLEPADWREAQAAIKIEAGEFVGAGDRYEIMRPGYQVVRDQMASPRRWVDVLGLSLSADRRTLVLRAPRQTEPVSYAITLPTPPRWRQKGGIPQREEIDLAVNLNGVEAILQNEQLEQRIILPHPSLEASATFTQGSAGHEAFFKGLAGHNATVSIRGAVDTSNPFVPAIQPGGKLDWDLAVDPFASQQFKVVTHTGSEIQQSSGNKTEQKGTFKPILLNGVPPQALGNTGLQLVSGQLKSPIPMARVRLPWAAETSTITNGAVHAIRTDVKGNWLQGRRVFFGEGGCATCHTRNGEGTAFGPDLSNLIHRDRESVLQDIIHPSATINPDHTGSVVKFANGVEQPGLIKTLNEERLTLALPAGAKIDVPRSEVTSIELMRSSLMPEGIQQQITAEQMEDLLTFLLVEGIQPAPTTRTDPAPPPARKMEEVLKIFGDVPQAPSNPARLRILLVGGPKDHGIDEHDYPLWLERWSQLLAMGEKVEVTTATGFPTAEQLAAADVALFYNANPDWNMEKAAMLDQFHEQGGGAVYLHYGVDGGKEPAAAAERIGLAFTFGSKFRHGTFDLVFTQADHPITRNFPSVSFVDETYWNMRGDVSRLNVIGTAVEDGNPQPELWTLERGKSRIVGCIPGHYTWTFDDPIYRALVFRSICWAARLDDVDRLAELSIIGARLAPATP